MRVGKSFQLSFGSLLAMLREDTHPPATTACSGFGGIWPVRAPSVCLLSWLAYWRWPGDGSSGDGLGHAGTDQVAAVAAAAFCSPYPIRFAIEGKSYALLVLLLVLAWCAPFGGPAGLPRCGWAGQFTHFMGCFWCWRPRLAWPAAPRTLTAAALVGALPALAWMATPRITCSALSWQRDGAPDYALLEETLARGLGFWPLPKLGLILLLLLVLRRWGGLRLPWPQTACSIKGSRPLR